ncbi:MAG: hypothetical protein OXF83_05235 [Anaerolineaceae bacterium]|nr:hypothetical protein [Anaerolineaceae bacterium]
MKTLANRRGVILLWGLTGLLSLVLYAFIPGDVSRGIQTAVVWVALLGTFAWLLRFLGIQSWQDLSLILAPAIGLILLGWLFFPAGLMALWGAAIGWLIVVAFLLRKQVPAAQRNAIRQWRKGDHAAAVRTMDDLIRQGDEDDHRLLRAQILLSWSKPGRAERDIREVCRRQPENAAAHNLLAEARIQAGDYASAGEAGERALALAPQDWVAAYNLGMIADRQQDAAKTVAMLRRAQGLQISAGRHRALTWFWLARAHCRLGEECAARECLQQLRAEKKAIAEWLQLLADEAAQPLRVLVAEDVTLAQQLVQRDEWSAADLKAIECGG